MEAAREESGVHGFCSLGELLSNANQSHKMPSGHINRHSDPMNEAPALHRPYGPSYMTPYSDDTYFRLALVPFLFSSSILTHGVVADMESDG